LVGCVQEVVNRVGRQFALAGRRMNSRHILFTTDRFNLSVAKPHFINPGCFGEELAAWLQARLIERDVKAGPPGQEDWGWYLRAKRGDRAYFLGMNGNADENSPNNMGEWRIIVEKRRSLWERVSRAGEIDDDDGMVATIREILEKESDFSEVRVVKE
jgi:hypothetical protein